MTMPHAMPGALLNAYRQAMRIGGRVGNARTDGRTNGADASKTHIDTSSTETRAPVQDFDISTRQVRRPTLPAVDELLTDIEWDFISGSRPPAPTQPIIRTATGENR